MKWSERIDGGNRAYKSKPKVSVILRLSGLDSESFVPSGWNNRQWQALRTKLSTLFFSIVLYPHNVDLQWSILFPPLSIVEKVVVATGPTKSGLRSFGRVPRTGGGGGWTHVRVVPLRRGWLRTESSDSSVNSLFSSSTSLSYPHLLYVLNKMPCDDHVTGCKSWDSE